MTCDNLIREDLRASSWQIVFHQNPEGFVIKQDEVYYVELHIIVDQKVENYGGRPNLGSSFRTRLSHNCCARNKPYQ